MKRTAATISDVHIKECRHITARGITGQLIGLYPVRSTVNVVLRVEMALPADEVVEVHTKEQP